MITKTQKLREAIYEASLNIENKIDTFNQQVIGLMNKQELLLKAINEDRMVITKILEHIEKLEKDERLTGGMGSVINKKGRKKCI